MAKSKMSVYVKPREQDELKPKEQGGVAERDDEQHCETF